MFTRSIATPMVSRNPPMAPCRRHQIRVNPLYERVRAILTAPAPIPSHCLDSLHCEQLGAEQRTYFPDVQLAQLFNRRFSIYRDEESSMTRSIASHHPKILTRYLRVADTMHAQGLIPIVHGQSAVWMIPQRILRVLRFERCRLLRLLPSRDRNEVIGMIDAEMHRRATHWFPLYRNIAVLKNLDLIPALRENLLSGTIGLFHCETKISPLSFVFGGAVPRGPHSASSSYAANTSLLSQEGCREIGERMIREAMQQRGFSKAHCEKFLSELDPLFQRAEEAEIGQLIVVGVPQRLLQRYTYHCERGGIPTGHSLSRILESIDQGTVPSEGCQVRLLMCREIIMSSEIEVVNVMDEAIVESFCRDGPDSAVLVEEALRAVSAEYTSEEERKRRRLLENRCLEQHRAISEELDNLFLT